MRFVYRAGEVAQALELDTSYTTYDELHSEYLILHCHASAIYGTSSLRLGPCWQRSR
jgi:hypothetical protein